MTFNKFSVALMYINIMGFPLICWKLGSWPPKVFTVCFFVFWAVQAFMTMHIHLKKRQGERKKSLANMLDKYVTEENIADVIEKVIKKVSD